MTNFRNVVQDEATAGLMELLDRVSNLESLAKVGGDSPLFGTGFVPNLRTVTTTYIPLMSDFNILGDATGGAFPINLPTAATLKKWVLVCKKIDISANAVTVTANGAETIDGAGTYALSAQYDTVIIQSDGVSAWHILALI